MHGPNGAHDTHLKQFFHLTIAVDSRQTSDPTATFTVFHQILPAALDFTLDKTPFPLGLDNVCHKTNSSLQELEHGFNSGNNSR